LLFTILSMRKITVAVLCLLVMGVSIQLHAQDTLRVMTYNILRYGAQGVGGCIPLTLQQRATWFNDVMTTTQPDIFGVNEIGPIDGAFSPQGNISTNVLPNVPGKGPFYQATQINFDGNQDICNMMYYNSQKVGLSTQFFIPVSGTTRNLDYYKFYYKSAEPIVDSSFIHVVLVHFMAGNATQREAQANALMNYLNSVAGGANDNYIVMGDMNMDTPGAGAFQSMVNYSNPNVRMYDPLSLSSWNQNWVYSQSTTPSNQDCRAGGGLNDRFDIILCSDALINNTLGMQYIPNSHWVVGNPHAPNPSVNTATQIGVNGMSDHFPVTIDIAVSQAVANDPAFVHPIELDVVSPVTEEAIVKLEVPEGFGGDYSFHLVDLQGRELYQKSHSLSPGSHILRLPLQQAGSGVFFLDIQSQGIQPLYAKIVRVN